MPFLANMFKYQRMSLTGTQNKALRCGARPDKSRSSNALARLTAEPRVRHLSTGSYNSSLFAVLIVRNSAAGWRSPTVVLHRSAQRMGRQRKDGWRG